MMIDISSTALNNSVKITESNIIIITEFAKVQYYSSPFHNIMVNLKQQQLPKKQLSYLLLGHQALTVPFSMLGQTQ